MFLLSEASLTYCYLIALTLPSIDTYRWLTRWCPEGGAEDKSEIGITAPESGAKSQFLCLEIGAINESSCPISDPRNLFLITYIFCKYYNRVQLPVTFIRNR